MNTFIEYISSNWPSIGVLLIVAFGVGKVVRMATKWEDKNEKRHSDSERRHNEIDSALREISKRVSMIERYLIKNGGTDYNEFTQMNSPRQLNPKGKKLYEKSGAEKFLMEKREALLRMLSAEMNKLKVKTALDVEVLAQRVCYEVSRNEDFKPIKDFVYTHPVFEGSNISIDTIAMLMGLELRNEYLKIHPEIDPTTL